MRLTPRLAFASAFGLAVVFVLVPVIAEAQPSPYPPPTSLTAVARKPVPHASVTISPIHLALPVFELAVELPLGRHFGATLIGGAGTIEMFGERFRAYEAGAQLAWYVTGDFGGGIKVGLESLYVAVEGGDGQGVQVLGEGFSTGTFLGWKKVWSSGFTLDLQGGVAIYTARADEAGTLSEAPESIARQNTATVGAAEVGPLLNLNLGWSF